MIEQQLQAFQDNNAEKAFSFASPGIQAQFGTADQFMAMVESSYPPVYRPRSVIFEAVAWLEGKVTQPVVLMGPNGQLFMALYMMQPHPNHQWRINGCFLSQIRARDE
ncbi:MAG: DUF4864 domain-containing protein [Cyanobacteria bacterium J06626_14]